MKKLEVKFLNVRDGEIWREYVICASRLKDILIRLEDDRYVERLIPQDNSIKDELKFLNVDEDDELLDIIFVKVIGGEDYEA